MKENKKAKVDEKKARLSSSCNIQIDEEENFDNKQYRVIDGKKVFFFQDKLNDDFSGNNIKAKVVDEKFKFVHKNPIWRFFAFIIYYVIAVPLLWLHAVFFKRIKFVNKKALKKLKKEKAFFYGNHTALLMDACVPELLSFPKRNKIIVSPDTVSIKGIKNLVQMVGALPVPSGINGMQKFVKAIEYYHKKFHLTIYPEAHIWPYYNDIRPFKDSSFGYPVSLNAPVVAFCTCFSKPKGMFAKFRKANRTVYISDPIYPDPNKTKNEAKKELRDKVYEFMLNTTIEHSTYFVYQYKRAETLTDAKEPSQKK